MIESFKPSSLTYFNYKNKNFIGHYSTQIGNTTLKRLNLLFLTLVHGLIEKVEF